jgi:hypothetical protein
MEQAETTAKLVALHKAVGRILEDPRGRYFDPAVVSEFFERWVPIRDALRLGFQSVLGDLQVRAVPVSSRTTDHEGRGYIIRQAIDQLDSDMQYALDALAALPSVTVPSMKITREGVFFAGQYFDALRELSDLVSGAQKSLSLVDAYVNADTLAILSAKRLGVRVQILTRDVAPALNVAAQAFSKQFGALEVRLSSAFHDRFLLVDDAEIYHFGASIKDVGHRGFMFSRVEEPEVIAALRRKYGQEWAAGKVVL